jgi:hypothetical protein
MTKLNARFIIFKILAGIIYYVLLAAGTKSKSLPNKKPK